MALADANTPLAGPPPLPPGPPYPCAALEAWRGVDWELPVRDPRLRQVDRGLPEPTPAFANLLGVRRAWEQHPKVMDFLDPDSPAHALKRVERELYEHHWAGLLPEVGTRVLDLGGGIGRFTSASLDRGASVELVDPDPTSLRVALDHAIGRAGALDLHRATGEELPPLALAPFDVAFLVEVLNYVEDPRRVLAEVARVLRPGGVVLGSVEARWGWAASLDAEAGTLPALWGDGVVHVPGDRWVHTWDAAELRALLAGWEILRLVPTHYVVSGPFEVAAGSLALTDVLDAEARLRAHPVAGPWNRAWTFALRRPEAGPYAG